MLIIQCLDKIAYKRVVQWLELEMEDLQWAMPKAGIELWDAKGYLKSNKILGATLTKILMNYIKLLVSKMIKNKLGLNKT